MADEDVLAVEGVGGTVAGSLPLLLVTLQEECAAAVGHVLARAVEVGAADVLAAPNGDTVVALGTATAVVPRHKEIVVAAVPKDERGLNGIGTGKTRRGIRLRGLEACVVAAGNGAWHLSFGHVHRRVEPRQLDAVPE